MHIQQALHDFHLANEADGRAAKTVDWYRWLLQESPHSLPLWLNLTTDLEAVDTKALREYIVWLRKRHHTITGEPLSEATIDDYIRALHVFFKWSANEYGVSNPMDRISYPKSKPRQDRVKAVALEDVGKMMAVCNPATDKGIRDRALLAFLIDTGCRAGGVCGLRPLHLDMTARTALVTEKGHRSRLVCFTWRTADLLGAWLERRHSGAPTVFHHSRNIEALTVNGLAHILKKIGKEAGVERCNTHAFRHAFAREYVKAGGDLATLSILLGHAQITTTTDYYTIFTQREVARKHELFSPMNRIAA